MRAVTVSRVAMCAVALVGALGSCVGPAASGDAHQDAVGLEKVRELLVADGDLKWQKVIKTEPTRWLTGKDAAVPGFAQELLAKKTTATTVRIALFKDEAEAARAANFLRRSTGERFKEGLWRETGREKVGDACWHFVDKQEVQLLVRSRFLCFLIHSRSLGPGISAPMSSSFDVAVLLLKKQFDQHVAEVRREDYKDVILTGKDVPGLKTLQLSHRINPGWKKGKRARWEIRGFRQRITFAGSRGTIQYVLFGTPKEVETGAIRMMDRFPYPRRKGLWEGAKRDPPGDVCWISGSDVGLRAPIVLVVGTGRLGLRIQTGVKDPAKRREVLLPLADTIVKKWQAAREVPSKLIEKRVKYPGSPPQRSTSPGAWRGTTLDDSQINTLLRKLLGIRPYEKMYISERFVGDINKDGRKEIVVAIAQRCTGDPVGIAILFRGRDRVHAQQIATHWGNVRRDLRDLDKDGKYEIVARSVLAQSTCHANCVEWHTVYEWDKVRKAYVEASVKYPSYYRDVYRPLVEKRLAHDEALDVDKLARNDKHAPDWWRLWKERSIADCHLALDKVKRLLNEDPRAGHDRARLWLKSGDTELKNNAIKVFRDIGDASSMSHLKTLAEDEDALISQRAKRALRELVVGVPDKKVP